MDEFELLRQLIKFNTVADYENNNIIEWISNYLSKFGFKNEIIKSGGKRCLVSCIGKNYVLGFSGHTDTVNYSVNWKYNPFDLTIKDGNLYGLGVCDMKGGIAAFLYAISLFDFKKIKKGLKLIFTFDEEISFHGIETLMKNNIGIPSRIILTEPTNLIPIIATKGCYECKVKLEGISTHSSTPEKGENAIYKVMLFINELKKIYNNLKKDKDNYTTFNVSTITGGNSINKVPDKCEFTFDFRPLSSNDLNYIKKQLGKLAIKYHADIEELNNIDCMQNNNMEMIQNIEKLCDKKSSIANYVTEASFYQKSDSIILGPGPMTAHEVNEYISIDSYEKCIEIYKETINYYCFKEEDL